MAFDTTFTEYPISCCVGEIIKYFFFSFLSKFNSFSSIFIFSMTEIKHARCNMQSVYISYCVSVYDIYYTERFAVAVHIALNKKKKPNNAPKFDEMKRKEKKAKFTQRIV